MGDIEDNISQCTFLQMTYTAENPHADGSGAPGARPLWSPTAPPPRPPRHVPRPQQQDCGKTNVLSSANGPSTVAQNYVSSAIHFVCCMCTYTMSIHTLYLALYLIWRAAIMVIPYTRLFIAASCNSRFSHVNYTLLSTQPWRPRSFEASHHQPRPSTHSCASGTRASQSRGLHYKCKDVTAHPHRPRARPRRPCL
jgi:hypothetical protein